MVAFRNISRQITKHRRLALALVPMIPHAGKEHSTGMVDPGEGREQYLRHGMMRAVVWMHIPGDIGEQTGSKTQPRFGRRFSKRFFGEDRCRPFEELIAMLLKARETPGEVAATFNQRVFRLLLLVEAIEQNARAKSVGRNDNFFRLHGRDELVEHQRAKRQRLHASARNVWHL